MFEPDFLTVAQLADRWRQTPMQILQHANALRVPLYFAFDGLAFDTSDSWHREGGDWKESNECAFLDEHIPKMEAHLSRNARGLTGKYDRLDPHEVKEMRAKIDEGKERRCTLARLLEQRQRERIRRAYRGYMRAAPVTLWEIMSNGSTAYPHKAFHPNGVIQVVMAEDGRAGWDGAWMALEPSPGAARYPKDHLASEDLFARFDEVKAIEAREMAKQHERGPGMPPADEASPERQEARTAERTRKDGLALAIEAGKVAYRARHKAEPTARALFEWLAENDATGMVIDFDEDSDKLSWRRADGGIADTTFKAFQNRLTPKTPG